MRGGPRWTVDVEDTGIGIAADRHALLFEPFAQADASIGRSYGGTGLGLARSRSLAGRLGGTLELVSSVPGEGSTYRLTLSPLTEEAAPAPVRPAPAAAGLRGLQVLLAEDNPDIRLAVQRLLEHAGAFVTAVADGAAARDAVLAGSFDVVLMDVRMPGMSGLEATRTLRDSGVGVPIIALTADAARTSRSEAIEAGCDDCLTKPFAISDLVTLIHTVRGNGA